MSGTGNHPAKPQIQLRETYFLFCLNLSNFRLYSMLCKILLLDFFIFFKQSTFLYLFDLKLIRFMSQAKLLEYVGIVIGLCVASWIFHIGYYKYMGHPWSAINGPQFDRTNGVQFKFYGWGKNRKFTWYNLFENVTCRLATYLLCIHLLQCIGFLK